MSDPINARKIEHIRAIQRDADVDRDMNYFDAIRLQHRALPEINLKDIDPSVTVMGKRLSFPLLISSMTGGDDSLVRRVNANLAIAAQATGVAMGLGSQRVMLQNENAAPAFMLRDLAPDVLLFANLGAVQLNNGVSIPAVVDMVDKVKADALFLHLNPLQEAIQPEGDTNFANLANAIGDLQKQLKAPIALKEVGAGLSASDICRGMEQGVRWFDVAGAGGTSWARIEQHRRNDDSGLGFRFQDWGIPTPRALIDAQAFMDDANFIASGGLRNGLDLIKSVILGARLGGIAKPFLEPAMDSPEAVIAVIETLKKEFVTTMFLLSAATVADVHLNSSLLLEK